MLRPVIGIAVMALACVKAGTVAAMAAVAMAAVIMVAGMAVDIMVAGMAVDIMVAAMVVGTPMVADIMAGLALRRALDMAVKTSVRSAMRQCVLRISATRMACTQAPSATVV